MQKSVITSLINFTMFVSIATAKYIPRSNQSKDQIYASRFRQMLTRTQNHRFSKNDNFLPNQPFVGQIRRNVRNRNQVFENNLGMNAKTGLSIQIGNHHIQQTANGIRLRLGVNSNKNSLNSANKRQFTRNFLKLKTSVGQLRPNLGQSRLTRIILMRNGKNGGRRNVVLKTSRGAQIHISRNTGSGRGIQYIINTGRAASDRTPAMRDFNNQVPDMRNVITGSNGLGQNWNTPTISPLFQQTTMVPDVSTTEPEDIDLFP